MPDVVVEVAAVVVVVLEVAGNETVVVGKAQLLEIKSFDWKAMAL